MALPHAILVSLRDQAGSGYGLARRFDRSAAVAEHGRPDQKVHTVSAVKPGGAALRGGIRAEESAIGWLDEVAYALRGTS